jgi:phage shock protein C
MSFWRRDYLWPAVLVVLGIYFLLRNFNLLKWLDGNIVWPVVLIILGIWLIVRRARA